MKFTGSNILVKMINLFLSEDKFNSNHFYSVMNSSALWRAFGKLGHDYFHVIGLIPSRIDACKKDGNPKLQLWSGPVKRHLLIITAINICRGSKKHEALPNHTFTWNSEKKEKKTLKSKREFLTRNQKIEW